ncbi:hypothetical protein LRR81_06375 [Metabacillus sp. GX 13764]|uniref:hypothetical protein n=1 Tax=Metabacillus kandeliae TaxID=2900151 RepID=UPI001E349E75|nr:hypothetical protein [Metabacillus kandeliae]MCD7033855.1 hypothetical protein [Metabacillus kandeliae]
MEKENVSLTNNSTILGNDTLYSERAAYKLKRKKEREKIIISLREKEMKLRAEKETLADRLQIKKDEMLLRHQQLKSLFHMRNK